MSADDKVPFLILATYQGNAYPAQFFVRAASLADAYAQVLRDHTERWQHPDIRLQGFVASTGMMAQALQLKELARFYWDAAIENAGLNRGDAVETEYFEATWDEHGAEPDVE